MRAAAFALVVLTALASPAVGAVFGQAAAATATHSTDQLAAPTGLSATAACSGTSHRISLAWTVTATSFATGYDVYRATGALPPVFLASVTARTTVTYVDTTAAPLTTYIYTVRTRFAAWTKASSTALATTPLICL